MEDVVLAGDVDVGDVIVLPDADEPVLVSRVRLGQGGLIFTVASASGDSPEQDRPRKADHEGPACTAGAGTWTASRLRAAQSADRSARMSLGCDRPAILYSGRMMVSNKTDLGERMRTASAGQRVTWSMLGGAVAGVVVSLVTVPSAAILSGWDVAVVIYLAWVWIAVWRLDPGTTAPAGKAGRPELPVAELVVVSRGY